MTAEFTGNGRSVKKTPSKINIYSMNIGCSGYFIVSNVRFLFFSLNLTTNGWLTGQRQHEYESVSHRPTVPHLLTFDNWQSIAAHGLPAWYHR